MKAFGMVYRCRMCGERYRSGCRTGDVDRMLPRVLLDHEPMASLIIPHHCADGKMRGLADLIGAERVDEGGDA